MLDVKFRFMCLLQILLIKFWAQIYFDEIFEITNDPKIFQASEDIWGFQVVKTFCRNVNLN